MKKSASLFQRAEEWISKHGLIEYGGAQLQDFCKELGINDKTYRRWLVEEEDFKQAIERAKEFYKQSLTHELHETLSMVATGYEREETETEYRPNPKDPNKPRKVRHINAYERRRCGRLFPGSADDEAALPRPLP